MKEVWRICLLGGLHAEREARAVTRFRTQKTAALLAYLAYYQARVHPRDELVERFWPDDRVDAARTSFRTALASLRRQMEPPEVPAGSVLIADRANVRLNPVAVTVDTAAFADALRAAGEQTEDPARIALLTRAVELYIGDLLPGFFDDWVLLERERLSQAYRGALRQLAQLLAGNGDSSRALDYAARAVAADSLDEEAHQLLMRLLIEGGQPAAALHQYHELERLLRTQLDAEPSPVSRSFAHELATMKADGRWQMSDVSVRQGKNGDPRETDRPSLQLTSDIRVPARSAGDLSSAPPSGTVTFLLTDIEGSTALWEHAGGAFRAALDRHHAVLRREFRRHHGYEVNEAGDSFVVAFADAADAVACAAAAQQYLAVQLWPEDVGAIKVRMVLHTGSVEPEGTTYRSLVLHHAARMLRVAHGGQILASEVTARLYHQHTGPADPPLRAVDLGLYRLRDVAAPQRLFQIVDPSGPPPTFPPLHAPTCAASTLPLPLTRFFGREREVAHLRELLGNAECGMRNAEWKTGRPSPIPHSARLVTLTGPGGSGKTRLAIEVARSLQDRFCCAVWFIPLADLADARLIPHAIAETLGLPRSAGFDPLPLIADALGDQPALLVLDNLEHLVDDGAPSVHELLLTVPHATCLVTSRRRLNIEGEQEFPVEPLPIPDDRCETISAFPSVQLFVDRAQAARPDFQVTPGNAAAVAALCRRLEGLPLALELAAARAMLFTPAQMLAQVSDRLDFLVSRRRDLPPRHRSLRAALSWSVETLPAELRRLFARLTVFRGGWTEAAAEAICEGRGRRTDTLDELDQLRECSLIRVVSPSPATTATETGTDAVRFRMMKALRQYGAEMLTPEETAALQRRHADFYLALAEEAYLLLQGPEQVSWLERLEAEHDNFRAVLTWCLSDPDDQRAEIGLRLAERLQFFWNVRGHVVEGRRWLAAFLAVPDAPEPTATRAAALYAAAHLASTQDDFAEACSLYERSLGIRRSLELWRDVADTLCQWGTVCEWMGDRVAAYSLYTQSLAICRELNEPWLLGHVLKCLGVDARARGDGESAREQLGESLALYREMGNTRGIAMVLGELARLALSRAENESAESLLQEYLQLSRGLKDPSHTAYALAMLGHLARERGDTRTASAQYAEGLELRRELGQKRESAPLLLCLAASSRALGDAGSARNYLAEGLDLLGKISDPWVLASCLDVLAAMLLEPPDPAAVPTATAIQATRLLTAAETLRTTAAGIEAWTEERPQHERRLALARALLGEEQFAAARASARAMTPKQALAEASRIVL